MKKLIATMLAVGLVAGAMSVPAQAKKASGGPVNFYLHWDDDGAGGCDGLVHMSPEDTTGDTSCWYVFQPAQEVLIAAGQGALTRSWPASAGLPLTLDGSKPVKGAISIGTFAAVNASLDVALTGLTKKGGVTLGETSVPITSSAPGTVVVEFSLKLPKKLNGATLTGLNLDTTIRGVTANSYVEMENPASFITIPTR